MAGGDFTTVLRYAQMEVIDVRVWKFSFGEHVV